MRGGNRPAQRCRSAHAPTDDPTAEPQAAQGERAAGNAGTHRAGGGGHRGTGTELRRAGDQPCGDAGHEDGEAEHGQRRQDGGHGVVEGDGARRRGDDGAEDVGADADDDGQHHQLDARGDDVAEHAFGQERGLAEQRERHQHEAGERGELELDDGDEQLDGEDEERQQHDQPGQHQHGDGDEVVEEGGEADQLAGLVEQRPRRGEAGVGDEPGRIRSCAVSDAALAFSPRPAKERKMMSASEEKLLSTNAKKPT